MSAELVSLECDADTRLSSWSKAIGRGPDRGFSAPNLCSSTGAEPFGELPVECRGAGLGHVEGIQAGTIPPLRLCTALFTRIERGS